MNIRSISNNDGIREYVIHPTRHELDTFNAGKPEHDTMCMEYIIKTDLPTSARIGDKARERGTAIDRGFEHYCDLGHTSFIIHFSLQHVTNNSHLGFTFNVIAHVMESRNCNNHKGLLIDQTIDLGEWSKCNPCYKLIPELIKLRP